jgi:hypothetical protein
VLKEYQKKLQFHDAEWGDALKHMARQLWKIRKWFHHDDNGFS